MTIKISCPLCQHSLSIKDPKAGKYKPKCSGCGEQFAIVIDSADPPEVKVGKLAKASKASAVEMTMEQPNSVASSLDAAGIADATIMHEEVSNTSTKSPSSQNPSRDFSVNEATSEQPASSLSAQSQPRSLPKADASSKPTAIANRLGGYRIVKELGAGGMGSVYLARQISLDRPCALKTIQAQWAQNPRVIARFIREAYAAAQLTHHNVVQIYDLGQDGGTNFFSMELVSGGSLDDQIKAKGKLPPKLAATLILQAARGLKFAHDHGMVHRDIKPANLMITSDGMVKIADMGLIKTRNADDLPPESESDVPSLMLASAKSQVTAIGSAMGTPAYMSPEQSTDAASVDKRADIYSLGCTFYALLVGKPPFEGNTMLDVISKHRTEKMTRPERIVVGLPTALGDVIERMTEKKPDDRYSDLDDVIHDLEVYLELREDTSNIKIIHHPSDVDETESKGQTAKSDAKAESIKAIQPSISPEHAGQLQLASRQFNSSPLLIARRFSPMAWFGLCGLMCVLSVLFAVWAGIQGAGAAVSQAASAVQGANSTTDTGTTAAAVPTSSKAFQHFLSLVSQLKTALGYLGALLIAPIAAIGFAGYEGRSPLAKRWRESFIAGGIFEWVYWCFAVLIAFVAIYFLGVWLPILIAIIFGVAAGAGYYFGIEKPIEKARKLPLEQAQTVLRQLRLKGIDENIVREIAAEHGGKNWQEFFESLFGYDAMRLIRLQREQSKRSVSKPFRPFRDQLIDQWEKRLADSRRQRDEKVLCRAEKAEMVAAGVSESEANKRAEVMAASMVEAANETRLTLQEIAAGKLTAQAADAKRLRIKQMLVEARSGKVSNRQRKSVSLDRLLGQLLGSKFRFACAALLLLGTGMWVQSNQKPIEGYWQQAKSTFNEVKNKGLNAKALENATAAIAEQSKLAIAQAPKQEWNSVGFGLVNQKNVLFVGLAGILMLLGTLMSGWKKSLILAPVAALLCLVPIWIW